MGGTSRSYFTTLLSEPSQERQFNGLAENFPQSTLNSNISLHCQTITVEALGYYWHVRNYYLVHSFLLTVLFSCLAGCTAVPTETASPSPTLITPTPRPDPTTTGIPTATATPPKPAFSVSSVILRNEPELGGLSVVGFIQNDTNQGLTGITIRASLFIDSDEPIVWKGINLPVKHIMPSEKVPFRIHFFDQTHADRVVVDVIAFQESGYDDAELEVEITGNTLTADGKLTLLGWIVNPGNYDAQLHQFQLLTFDSEEEPITLVSASIYPSSLLPTQRVPFLISLDYFQEPDSLSTFTDATVFAEPTRPSFSFLQNPEIVFDSQGNLLIRGIIQNDDITTKWISAIVALLYQDQIVSVTTMNPPSPLSSGQTRAFGIMNFPGWSERLNELNGEIEDLSIEVFFDPLGCLEFTGQVIPLIAEITGFESTGSTLFIQGTTLNPSSHSLSIPAVQAEIRTTNGLLQTSNWTLLDEKITEGQSLSFTLALRLPNGIELSQMEIDVIATAILENSD